VRHGCLSCEECRRESDEHAAGWRAYLLGEDDDRLGPDGVVVYCPECAECEGWLRRESAA